MSTSALVKEHLEDCIFPMLAKSCVFAKELGIKDQVLARRLRAEGTTWKTLVSEETAKRIRQLRRDGISEPDIAEELGYETFGGYVKACKKMFAREHA